MSETPSTPVMNRKPVLFIPAKGVINMASKFKEKLLCDGPTFSTGTACAYSCPYCYVSNMMRFQAANLGVNHAETVIRRKDALKVMRDQLTKKGGKPKYDNANDNRVIYASPLVDVAPNAELTAETVEACRIILELTNWQIRLLSKSTFLPRIAAQLEPYKHRMIYGVSTGTLDDSLARVIETGTPLVSKRLQSLRELQDMGCRTYAMLCPTMPANEKNPDRYHEQAEAFKQAINFDRCEHIWAEVMNVRGENLQRTASELVRAGFKRENEALQTVMASGDEWEDYAQMTFLGYCRAGYPLEKLRFLQYVNAKNFHWWRPHAGNGAVLLGKEKIETP